MYLKLIKSIYFLGVSNDRSRWPTRNLWEIKMRMFFMKIPRLHLILLQEHLPLSQEDSVIRSAPTQLTFQTEVVKVFRFSRSRWLIRLKKKDGPCHHSDDDNNVSAEHPCEKGSVGFSDPGTWRQSVGLDFRSRSWTRRGSPRIHLNVTIEPDQKRNCMLIDDPISSKADLLFP